MKIIYATNNTIGSKSLLHRIKLHLPVKSIGYSYLNTDLTIDAINANDVLIYKENYQNVDFKRLYNQIAYIKPDLVISELNVPITYIASLLNIETYQVSPVLLYFALENTGNNMFKKEIKKMHYSLIRFYTDFSSIFSNLLFNSSKLFVYHYLNDLDTTLTFDKRFTFIKPYIFKPTANNPTVDHVINTIEYKKILKKLNSNATVVNEPEFVTNSKYIDPNDIQGYSNSLNCNNLYNSGETSILADGIYNRINTTHRIITTDIESNMNNAINKKLGICNQFYIEDEIKVNNYEYKLYNNSKYLHEYII